LAGSPQRLAALPVPGLPPDSPGNYLASLGLLRLLARTWPSVRIAWREEILQVVGGPRSIAEVVEVLGEIARKREWTPYERGWADAQKKSTNARSGAELAVWQGAADETCLELFIAHAVPAASVSFNPLLGTGGNAGRRSFSTGWRVATDELAEALRVDGSRSSSKRRSSKAGSPDAKQELAALLLGEPTTWLLENLNAASWFSNANKLYNSGQKPFREGLLSPWVMALACEGLAFLAGGASRRLGAQAHPSGAFPFVTNAAAPDVSGEAGRDLAEFWAPLWDRPMTLPETRALFTRGRAEIRGRGAVTPSAFATAILRRGVDAGISEFRRFVFARTTSPQTFEPRFEGAFSLSTAPAVPKTPSAPQSKAASTALERILDLLDHLPKDRKTGQRWRFVGLRGPIEKAMLQVAARPEDAASACRLLDAVVASLDRVDRNRSFRERRISWEPLPLDWLPALFGASPPTIEARLALAAVSVFPEKRPFALYRFGVHERNGHFEHPVSLPRRWVWRPGPLARVLSQVLLRRTLDWESDFDETEPARSGLPATLAEVSLWLEGLVDDDPIAQWLSRLALFDWRPTPSRVRTALGQTEGGAVPLTGALALYGLFSPLFDLRPLHRRTGSQAGDLLDRESGARTPAAARALASLLRTGRVAPALGLACSRYTMAGTRLAKVAAPWDIHDPDRLLASMLFPASNRERSLLIERWLRPARQKGEPVNA